MSSVQASNDPMLQQRWWHLCTQPWVAVLLRVLLGGVFIFAGFSKLLLPHAEVVAHVQQYQVLPAWLVSITAMFLPWIEVGSGTALLVGFYTTLAALLIALQLLTFSALMVIVLAAGIPLRTAAVLGTWDCPRRRCKCSSVTSSCWSSSCHSFTARVTPWGWMPGAVPPHPLKHEMRSGC